MVAENFEVYFDKSPKPFFQHHASDTRQICMSHFQNRQYRVSRSYCMPL